MVTVKIQEPEVILPHFKPEEIEALRVEHERREQGFKGRGLFSLDEERVRDGVQRADFWTSQIAYLRDRDILDVDALAHAEEELAHSLAMQGRLSEALTLARDPERRTYYLSIYDAIMRSDDEWCACSSEPHTIGHFPSAKHGGKMTDIAQCPECKTMNIR